MREHGARASVQAMLLMAGLVPVALLPAFCTGATMGVMVDDGMPVRIDFAEAPAWLVPDMVWIPPGSYWMGSPDTELFRHDDERLHAVTLTHGFHMGESEVTQAQWASVMGSNPSHNMGCDDCPVEYLTWYEAVAYCNTLSLLMGRDLAYEIDGEDVTWLPGTDGYRLPTESEWEYACRAGTSTAFYNGPITEGYCDLDPNLDEIGWYCGNSLDETQPVAQKSRNVWDLYDMSGNVLEYCWDWYDPEYPVWPVTDPTGPPTGLHRVCRGGSAYTYSSNCRSAERVHEWPNERWFNVGFRLVASSP